MGSSLKYKKIVFQIIIFQTIPSISNNDRQTDNTKNVCEHIYRRSVLSRNIGIRHLGDQCVLKFVSPIFDPLFLIFESECN